MRKVWMVYLGNMAEWDVIGVYDYEPTPDEAQALAVEEKGEARVRELSETLHGSIDVEPFSVESRPPEDVS